MGGSVDSGALNVRLFPVTRVEGRVGGRATFTWGGPEEEGVEVHEVSEYGR